MYKWKQNTLYAVGGLLIGGAVMFALGHLWITPGNERDLLAKIKYYEDKEQEAIITKRVSQQMEEIAYQQKEISDLDRQEAEEQFHVAEQMRQRAEEGQRAAHEAQAVAVRNAHQADSMRILAISQMTLAEDRLNQVIVTQRKNDTLSYRSLANSLATSSLDLYKAGNKELSNMLAYSAYTFSQRYQAQAASVLKSVLTNGPLYPTLSLHKGSIEGLALAGKNKAYLVSVSSYGEIAQSKNNLQDGGEHTVVFSDSKYDFRDVIDAEGDNYYALGFHGWLWKGNVSSKSGKFIQLPGKKYFDIVRFDEQRLLLASKNTVSWYGEKEEKVTYDAILPLPLSAICVRDHLAYLFYQNGTCQTMNAMGQMKKFQMPVKGRVSIAVYSSKYDYFVLGMQDGAIHLMSTNGTLVNSLLGHYSAITDIQLDNDYLVTSSFDNTVRIWFLNQEKSNTSVNSVDLSYKSWPVCLYVNPTTQILWVGFENGTIQPSSLSVPTNIHYIKQQVKRNYTQEEWNNYMGLTIPYEKIR